MALTIEFFHVTDVEPIAVGASVNPSLGPFVSDWRIVILEALTLVTVVSCVSGVLTVPVITSKPQIRISAPQVGIRELQLDQSQGFDETAVLNGSGEGYNVSEGGSGPEMNAQDWDQMKRLVDDSAKVLQGELQGIRTDLSNLQKTLDDKKNTWNSLWVGIVVAIVASAGTAIFTSLFAHGGH